MGHSKSEFGRLEFWLWCQLRWWVLYLNRSSQEDYDNYQLLQHPSFRNSGLQFHDTTDLFASQNSPNTLIIPSHSGAPDQFSSDHFDFQNVAFHPDALNEAINTIPDCDPGPAYQACIYDLGLPPLASELDLFSTWPQSQSDSTTEATPDLSLSPLSDHSLLPPHYSPLPRFGICHDCAAGLSSSSTPSGHNCIPRGRSHIPESNCAAVFGSYGSLLQHQVSKHKPRNYVCNLGECTQSFEHEKDLRRHQRSRVHQTESTPLYRCSCGKGSARKDHHHSHMNSCHNKANRVPHNPYTCLCGNEEHEFDAHQAHIDSRFVSLVLELLNDNYYLYLRRYDKVKLNFDQWTKPVPRFTVKNHEIRRLGYFMYRWNYLEIPEDRTPRSLTAIDVYLTEWAVPDISNTAGEHAAPRPNILGVCFDIVAGHGARHRSAIDVYLTEWIDPDSFRIIEGCRARGLSAMDVYLTEWVDPDTLSTVKDRKARRLSAIDVYLTEWIEPDILGPVANRAVRHASAIDKYLIEWLDPDILDIIDSLMYISPTGSADIHIPTTPPASGIWHGILV
ncbi:hypothetical protein PG993_011369 [Apiospora rasikravindrae]|uniref:C2H2-type domain-containing protein n=1 Tax=Apiospora rasikravindrae TaxID=990691 RepID=A0ABR1SE50_9PEZI